MSNEFERLTKALVTGEPVRGVGDNNPPEPTIVDIVLQARQAKDDIEIIKADVDRLEAPFRVQMAAASADLRAELATAKEQLASLTAKIKVWQEKQRRANPFADGKEVSRVIIDGEVAATTRATESFEIIKEEMVPRELCSPNDTKIKAALALGKEVPGVRKHVVYSTVVR